MKIILQELKEGYILQTLADGSKCKVLYEVDGNGNEYIDLTKRDTNDDL